MIKRIVHFALNQPLFILLGLVLFIGAGIAAFRSLPIEAFPDVTDTQVTVISLYPGRAPEEVEKQVTIPLEIALSGVPNSIRMFSHTQFGLSFIVITFDEKPSLFVARQLVEERLRGGYMAENRRGEFGFQALPTLSIGAVRLVQGDCESHREVAAAASAAKKQAKKKSRNQFSETLGSSLFIDRRRPGAGEPENLLARALN
jgi:hypothetical protein